MRTKTLLLTAAITAVGLASSLAQSTNVYSANIVGYVNYVNPPGYRIICNPLNSTNNDVSNIFVNPPQGFTIYKRVGAGFDAVTYDPDFGGWLGTMTLDPGEGAFMQNPSAGNYTNTFVGEVVLNSTNAIPNGYSLKSSVVPQAGGVQTVLGFPVRDGDTFHRYTGTGYDSKTFDSNFGGWFDGEFQPAVGEGFWVQTSGAATNWVRNFSVQ